MSAAVQDLDRDAGAYWLLTAEVEEIISVRRILIGQHSSLLWGCIVKGGISLSLALWIIQPCICHTSQKLSLLICDSKMHLGPCAHDDSKTVLASLVQESSMSAGVIIITCLQDAGCIIPSKVHM